MARERAIANQLAKLLHASNSPIYAVDDRRRIVFCNAACANWLGITIEDLVGLQCNYLTEDSVENEATLASRLCPPPEAFDGASQITHTKLLGSLEESTPRSAECIRLNDGDASVGLLVIVREKTETTATADNSTSPNHLHLRLQQLVTQLRMPYRLGLLVGESLAIQRVREQVRIVIETLTNVQLVGPTGSGREHVARTIHAGKSPELVGGLMPLECNLLDGELLQATVIAFLHRAKEADPAHPATLLLLNVDQLNAESQAELLAFFRVPTFELRTIVTTQQSLIPLAEQGEFLRELAYRLSPMTIEMQSLQERREDIPLLCQRFLEDSNSRGEKQLSRFAPNALEHLTSLTWSGGVEELRQVITETCEQADGPIITKEDLSHRVKLITSAMQHPAPVDESIKLDEFLLEVEKELLQRALRTTHGNKAEAARLLGISRARVIRRATQWELG